jgi:hypothetical protein
VARSQVQRWLAYAGGAVLVGLALWSAAGAESAAPGSSAATIAVDLAVSSMAGKRQPDSHHNPPPFAATAELMWRGPRRVREALHMADTTDRRRIHRSIRHGEHISPRASGRARL